MFKDNSKGQGSTEYLLLLGGVIVIAVVGLVIYGAYFNGTSLKAGQDIQKVRNSTMMFVGSKESNLFHKPSCQYVKQILEKNKIYYMTRDEAIRAGKSPCSVCKP